MDEYEDNSPIPRSAALDRLLRHRIKSVSSLPPVPRRSQELLRLLADDDLSVVRLVELIEQTPPLAARVLGVANSAFFASPQPAKSVSDAIIRVLGLNLVRDLCLSQALSVPFNTDGCPLFDSMRFWRQAMATATLAQRIAGIVTISERGSLSFAYLAGLMHSIGMLVLVHLAPGSMNRILQNSEADGGRRLSDLQKEVLGIDYAQAGGEIARAWHLPDPITAVLTHHRNPAFQGESWPLVGLVALADHLAKSYSATRVDDAVPAQFQALLDNLGLSASEIDPVITSRRTRLDAIERLAVTFEKVAS